MPNVWSKLPEIIGAWVGLAIGLFLMPLFLLPAFLFGWIMCDWASPAAIYSFLYDKTFMTIVGVALLLLLIWTEGFKASLDEAPFLANLKATDTAPGRLWRVFLYRNSKLAQAYRNIDDFEQYLLQVDPDLYRHHTQALSFFPAWLEEYVGGHTRRGHVRYTQNGPVNVRSHYVSGHTRARRR
ncbi:hypothetical protein PSH76_26215 [Pseudomonas sp. FP215]|uniref:hypothetical protein n=1 Tax=Pseudomonas sp. FP215 TaxID=2738126 RepID=UPI00273543B9|nr:hypothetical protein [Pseudomonas sp. FP215]WLH23473.1 hypothetical protein PSH76_26215 [Pseudomonas sp. FP215]